MNFLQLCQRACIECGVASGSAILTALPTVAGATGSLGRVVGWVADAWSDVQMAFDDWSWMRSSVLLGAGAAFQTVAGQASYPLAGSAPPLTLPLAPPLSGGLWNDGGLVALAPGPDAFITSGSLLLPLGTVGVVVDSFGKWDRETFRIFPTAVGYQGEGYLDEVPYDTWRDSYMFGAMRAVQTRPIVIAVGPDQSLNLGPPPSGLYTVTADYFVAPSEMVTDTDIPVGLPTRFHMLICYYAMQKYAGYESAPEVMQRGSSESTRMMAQLMALRAPRISFGGSLA